MPRRAASAFILATNASSLPPVSSASAIDASLPDWMIMPRTSSSTETARRGSMNIREPSARHARCGNIHHLRRRNRLRAKLAEDQVRRHELGQRRGIAALVGVDALERLAARHIGQHMRGRRDRRRRNGGRGHGDGGGSRRGLRNARRGNGERRGSERGKKRVSGHMRREGRTIIPVRRWGARNVRRDLEACRRCDRVSAADARASRRR